MQIIGGRFRGRTLRTVQDLSVRPATGRVRQTIFDMLTHRMDFAGARVLDLFAGSGSLGIEALSRGAASAVFVESGRRAADLLEQNLSALGCAEMAEVVRQDAEGFIERERGAYQLLFADPPYAFPATASLPGRIFGRSLVAPEGILLIEHSTDVRFDASPAYRIGPVKQFGRTVVTFFQGPES